MGSQCSSLYDDDEEIAVYIQRPCFSRVYKGFGRNAPSEYYVCSSMPSHVFYEPGHFSEPKPATLWVDDELWNALKTKVDPLARLIIDPHRSYLGAALMCLLISTVFFVIRPTYNITYYDDDDQYQASNELDDVAVAQWEYWDTQLEGPMYLWHLTLYVSLTLVCFATLAMSIAMEVRNSHLDMKIATAVDDFSPRFEEEGFSLEYRTRVAASGVLAGHLRPERVVVFRKLVGFDHQGLRSIKSNASNNPYESPNTPAANDHTSVASSERRSPSVVRYGTFMVTVPPEYLPGQAIAVTTPSGQDIMVDVPNWAQIGDIFAVQVPTSMLQSKSF